MRGAPLRMMLAFLLALGLMFQGCDDSEGGGGDANSHTTNDGTGQDTNDSTGQDTNDSTGQDTNDGTGPSGSCTVGAQLPENGCTCEGIEVKWGWCCEDGWSPIPCEPEHRTCADLGIDNCVEIWPGEQRDGYEYYSGYEVYFLRNLSNEDHYFLLMGDIDCTTTCIVAGLQDGNPDVDATTTIDLNGYTIRYSADDYEEIPNNDFESWDSSMPVDWTVVSGDVEPRSTSYWMPMHGDWVLYTPSGAVLESSSIHLPRARWYQAYVTVGRSSESQEVTIEVVGSDDSVLCSSSKQGTVRGQTVWCRFLAEGEDDVRLRITAGGEAYLDRTGIVPLGDYGIAALTGWSLSDSNQYQLPIVQNLDGLDIPTTGDHASPERYNHLRIINGRIIAAHENQESYGIRTMGIVRVEVDSVVIKARGIKSHSIKAGGNIHHSRLQVDMPWYFSREASEEENVILQGGEFHDNLAIGGQGVIRLRGQGTKVYRNYLRNNAQATNHYAIIHSGAEDPEIYENVFDPIEGSGILTYVGHGYRIHHNVFYVRTATCNVEYVNEDYSTNGIRFNDYGSGDNHDNWVYDNVFYIEGREFETAWENCKPVTTGIFYSAAGSGNRIFRNEFHITKTTPRRDAPVIALYMGGDGRDAYVQDNVFYTNDKAIWLATYYGSVDGLTFENNTFIREDNTYYEPEMPEAAIRMGWWRRQATNLTFINNKFENGFEPGVFEFTDTTESSVYDLVWKWYVHVTVVDGDGAPVQGAEVRAVSADGGEEVVETTDGSGQALLVLTQFTEEGDMRPDGVHDRHEVTPHTITVTHGSDSTSLEVVVDGEKELLFTLP